MVNSVLTSKRPSHKIAKHTRTIRRVLPTNCLSVYNYFVRLTLKGQLFYDGGPYHTETILLIWSVSQWTGFYMIGTSVIKVLIGD